MLRDASQRFGAAMLPRHEAKIHMRLPWYEAPEGFRERVGRVKFLRVIDRSKTGIIMSDTATLSAKFQISIPKAVRTARRWKAGQEFAFIPKGTGVLLVPVPELAELAGIAKGAKPKNFRDRKDRF